MRAACAWFEIAEGFGHDLAMANRGVLSIRPFSGARALRALLKNPDDTSQVFRVIRAFSGGSLGRLQRRVRRDPQGARILRERRDLLPVLSDRERLRELPEGSLGCEYALFMDVEKISAEGLAQASALDAMQEGDLDPEQAAFGKRLRDMHDLWHVVTGYGRDVLGELALLAFTYEQTRNRGLGVIVRVARWKIHRNGARNIDALLQTARERGRQAACLPIANWEALLELPLGEVRRELQVGEPVPYEGMRSAAGEAAAA